MFNLVLACQESMWEVLNDRIRNRESELKELGWDDEDIEAEHARQRFDKLLERYQGCVNIIHGYVPSLTDLAIYEGTCRPALLYGSVWLYLIRQASSFQNKA